MSLLNYCTGTGTGIGIGIGTYGSMSQKLVGWYQMEGLIQHNLEVKVEKKSGKYLQNQTTLHLPFPITEGIKTLQ